MPSSVTSGDKEVYLLDRNKQNLYSEFIRRSRMQLPVVPEWEGELKPQRAAPPNPGSATRALNSIVKHLRAGQAANRYLVPDINLLPMLRGVTSSPFGAVQKGEVDLSGDARVIHDASVV
ncbi:hypothetical protein PHYSODRAFT_318847 [Phytophthora sojae]|uniref:Uncharacterized protein n=1 Tax=Phytophthora sojae (strain P6497) TaxID=1094619 RepID=G5A739_PHYSP|nr:hypothetical protein PHYSODRAFT_318847 [Phytophthora sojae]EGZ09144.1 hypothetical protein PHYSODRAFT_318847 [Phytophthora sojae]|eukprot:XP_009535777.1 hypothetical protein PHYSODRAFT_318847 [Phytophthora sojae]